MSTAPSPPIPKDPLAGRIVLVTGGTRGIGAAISHRFSVSSVIGGTGSIGQANYAASKSGLFGLAKSLARESMFMVAFLAHDDSSYITGQIWSVNGGLDM